MAIKDIGVRTVIEGLGGFLQGMDRYNTAIGRAEQRTRRFGEVATRAGLGLTALAAPILALGAVSARTAIQFETAMIGVRKTVDATEEQFADLERQFRATALVIPVAVNELARLGEAAGQLGVEVDNIAEFTRVMAALGVTTELSSLDAATALARMASIMGLAQDQFEPLGSAIVELGNNLETTEPEIVDFALRIAGAGKLVQLTTANILAIGAAMSSVGVEAASGGTAVTKVLVGISQAVAQGSAELDVFAATAGVTVDEFARLFRSDAAKAFTLFVEGLGLAGQDAFDVLEELGFADIRLTRGILSLAGAGDKLRTSVDMGTRAWEENTALATEAALRYGSMQSQIDLATNSVNELQLNIGNALAPVLIALTQALIPLVDGFATWAGNNVELIVTVAGLATVVGGLGIGLVAVGFILPAVIASIGFLGTAVGFVTAQVAALLVVLGPVGLIILAIGAAVAVTLLIWRNWELVLKGIKLVLNAIIQAINIVLEGLALIPRLFGVNVSVPNIPTFAAGGIQGRSGPAIVGDRGPEVVNLPAGSQVSPISNATTYNVNAQYGSPQSPGSLRLDLEAINMMTRS